MLRQLTQYSLEDILDFGKYNGFNIKEVYQFDPDYLEWCIETVEYFYVDLDHVKALPKPTPMRLCFIAGYWVSNHSTKNHITDAHKYLSEGHTLSERNFQFSEEALSVSNQKKERVTTKFQNNSQDNFIGESEDYESYGSSHEKYGGYNGYSDDAIDDAFEGDPENTWNVD
jgi:hypothetical protein